MGLDGKDVTKVLQIQYNQDIIQQLVQFGHNYDECIIATMICQNINDSVEIKNQIDKSNQQVVTRNNQSTINMNDDIKDDNIDATIALSIKIQLMVAMGFNREIVVGALKLAHGDINAAINIIDAYDNLEQKSIEKLIKMGFDRDDVILALIQANNDIENAALLLIQHHVDTTNNPSNDLKPYCWDITCAHENNVLQCIHLKKLKQTMTNYENTSINVMQQTLNNFNHLLVFHNNDEQFEQIYNHIGKCQIGIKACNTTKRRSNNTIKGNINVNRLNDKQGVWISILDTIHHYYCHTYDIGLRLTLQERRTLHTTNDDIKTDNINDPSGYYETLNKIIDPKRKIRGTVIQMGYNKFKNDLLENVTVVKSANSDDIYCFGIKYYYWTKFDKYTFYVKQKYSELKDELLANGISMELYNKEYDKSQECTKTFYGKYIHPFKGHENRYNYTLNIQSITICHILAVKIYCNYDEYQYNFGETYRRKPNESDEHIKNRHAEHYWMGRYITECVQSMGHHIAPSNQNPKWRTIPQDMCQLVYPEPQYGRNKQFFRGVTKQFYFTSTTSRIFCVMSTTSALEVALNFANKTGMVVELRDASNGWLTYFDTQWLSDYTAECELLFCGCDQSLQICNIRNVVNNMDYEIYITALNIINQMTNGMLYSHYSQPDNNNGRISNKKTNSRSMVTVSCCNELFTRNQTYRMTNIGLLWEEEKNNTKQQQLSPFIKSSVIQLIKHELNKYKYPYFHCKQFQNLDDYIDKLLHYYCVNKKKVTMDWEQLNMDVISQKGEECGFLGYKFLNYLFCQKDFECINIELIRTLFPKLKQITLKNQRKGVQMGVNTMEYILKHLNCDINKNSHLNQIKIMCANAIVDSKKIIDQYQHKFNKIGYRLDGEIRKFNMRRIAEISRWNYFFISGAKTFYLKIVRIGFQSKKPTIGIPEQKSKPASSLKEDTPPYPVIYDDHDHLFVEDK